MNTPDVSGPIDLRLMSDALIWEKQAMSRPFRVAFFEAITTELQKYGGREITILELGSGPGFLASHILARLSGARMSLLDFSPAMHELAGNRLEPFADRITFIERDFCDPHWFEELGEYDVVVTVQAVHELRHKRYATAFHRQVRALLKLKGHYLFCDHYCGDDGMKNDELFMTLDEQRSSLESAGYEVTDIMIKSGRALYLAV